MPYASQYVLHGNGALRSTNRTWELWRSESDSWNHLHRHRHIALRMLSLPTYDTEEAQTDRVAHRPCGLHVGHKGRMENEKIMSSPERQ